MSSHKPVEIADFEATHREAFSRMNRHWIEAHFEIEPEDSKALDHPQQSIIEPGGHILVALIDDQVVGCCALIKMDDHFDFELAKMAVIPEAQGRGIGKMLGEAVIDRARQHGARHLYLESNTVLSPALQLYRKLGFTEIHGHPTPYTRCNIQMALTLQTIGV